MRSPAHCTSCCAFVGADAYIGPTYRTLLQPIRRGRRPRRPDPNFSRTYGRAHGPCPTRCCVIGGGRTGSSAPTNRSVGRGALTPPPDLHRTPLQKPCHCETSDRGHWFRNPSPPSLAPLPKGGWHGEAVTGGFFSCARCNTFVGAGFYPARGRGRAPPLRTARYTSVGADAYIGPTGFFRTRQGTRALPYKALRYRGRADRVVRPYKPFRRAGPMCPAAHGTSC